MATQFLCNNPQRLRLVELHPMLNGIRYVEVVDREAPEGLKQRTLLVFCAKALGVLTATNLVVEGGVRIRPIVVEWAHRVDTIPAGLLTAAEQPFFAAVTNPDHVLAVRFKKPGDYSWYRLLLREGPTSDKPPANFDGPLSEIRFQFKAECPSDFDCASTPECPVDQPGAPPLDYLSKDYASFRRMMLDRLAVTLPQWTETSPADLGHVLVEVMAHAADHLSYYQDAVATEAYLATARQRASVGRHARMLDYRVSHGQNARAWVYVEAGAPDTVVVPGLQFLTRIDGGTQTIAPATKAYDAALAQGPVVFEAMHRQLIYPPHNRLRLYTWGDEQCCLPRGATRATLKDDAAARLRLRRGDVIVFEEVLGPETGLAADAEPARRHAVRLAKVDPEATLNPAGDQLVAGPLKTDTLTGQPIVEIEWGAADALPVPLCVSAVINRLLVEDVTVGRGNIVLADHGRTIRGEQLSPSQAPLEGVYHPALRQGPVTRALEYDHAAALAQPAQSAVAVRPADALAAVTLEEENDVWTVEPDLLGSSRFTRAFVVEPDEDGVSRLRFGDGRNGMRPAPGAVMTPVYRVGNGAAGNIGRDSLAHVVTALAGIVSARNPIPAVGGSDPEPAPEVKLYAPQAFRTQRRAITEEDYATRAAAHSGVQKAVATMRWAGSWHTVYVTVDRKGGRLVDAAFRTELREWLEPYRMAGVDLEIDNPEYVPLDIVLTVCAKPGFFRHNVREALLEAFVGSRGGSQGFFHPDRLTFGQTVFLSQVIATAMSVPGVAWVDVDDTLPKQNRFQRWGEASRGELRLGRLELARLEIAQVANDPNAAENGRIEILMEGGV